MNDLWDTFIKSGRVEDYIAFRRDSDREDRRDVMRSDEFQNRRSDNP